MFERETTKTEKKKKIEDLGTAWNRSEYRERERERRGETLYRNLLRIDDHCDA